MFVRLIDTELRDLIVTNKWHNTVILEAIWALQGGEWLPMNSKIDDWTFDNGLIFYKDKCYVPNDLDLWQKILEKYHDAIPIGHPGQLCTQEIIQRDYWWPGLHTFIKNYVDGCAMCQQHKINQHLPNPPLQPIKKENTCPFSLITMDFITNLLISDGYDSIMVTVDHGSMKGEILEPCNKTIDTAGNGKILLDSLYWQYGLLSGQPAN